MKPAYQGKANVDPHFVLLPWQAMAILRELHQLTGDSTLLFSGERGQFMPISDNT